MNSIANTTTFILYFAIILVIGFIANRRTQDLSGYVLGERSLNGPITALGVGASDMSGWLLLGLPGAVFAHGLNQIWLPLGLSLGAYINWRWVAPRIRVYTEIVKNSLTIPAYLDNRFNDTSGLLRVITALVILLFFTFYAAAGFVSGALVFNIAFHLSYYEALWIGAAFIMFYTCIGGFLAVSWTDFFQGTLMFFALVAAPIIAFHHVGGWALEQRDIALLGHKYLTPFSDMTTIGILSLLGWGLGYFGQAHILMRFMAVKSTKELPSARRIGMSWMIISLLGAVAVGVVGRLYFSHSLKDSETVFLDLGEALFNPWVASILLAAVLSAVMSTVAAQLLAASSALTEDFYHRFFRKNAGQKELLWICRATVALIAIVALLLAHNPNSSVLDLVGYAWAGMGAAFGPALLLSLFWVRTSRNGAVAGIIAGAFGVIAWTLAGQSFGGFFKLYELIPGFIFSILVTIIASLMSKKPAAEIQAAFEQVNQTLKQ